MHDQKTTYESQLNQNICSDRFVRIFSEAVVGERAAMVSFGSVQFQAQLILVEVDWKGAWSRAPLARGRAVEFVRILLFSRAAGVAFSGSENYTCVPHCTGGYNM